MGLTRLGRDNIAALIVSTGAMRPWSATGGVLVVGGGFCSTGAETPASSFLESVSSNSRDMSTQNASFPSRVLNVMSFQATFSTNQALFAWNEWGVYNSTTTTDAAAALLNRKLESPSLGTKTSAQSWQLQVDITVTT